MKNKILFGLNFMWASFMAFAMPVCSGWIYMDITGHSKGYSYDLGDEKSISILVGFVELIIWLVLAVPSNIYLFRRVKKKIIPVIIFAGLFLLCVNLIGGWGEFGRFFNIGGVKY